MGVVVESSVWEPSASLFIFIFLSCFLCLFIFPHVSKSNNKSPSLFDLGTSSSWLRFQRNFLLLYSLSSVMEGLWSTFGEFELASFGVSKERMVTSLCVGFAAALVIGTFFGMLSDLIGTKKVCLVFCILHLFVGIWKKITAHPSIWVVNVCLSLATTIFSCSFETWVVLENEKQGHRKDTLSDLFWLMTFFESASLIGSQVLVNLLVGGNGEKGMVFPASTAVFLAMIGIIYVSKGQTETTQTAGIKDYRMSFNTSFFGDKRILLLACAQSCLQFSIAVFWILWAPMLVADGREVNLGLIYPCFLGARMLGSTVFHWLLTGPSSLRTEDCLVYVFTVLGLALFLIAYDYQEVEVMVLFFCLFHAGVGVILPSLARLRTMYVPNELRGGMISFSQAPANAAMLFFLMQRGYYQNIENSTMMAFAALGLFVAAVCMHLLKRWGKQPYQSGHKL